MLRICTERVSSPEHFFAQPGALRSGDRERPWRVQARRAAVAGRPVVSFRCTCQRNIGIMRKRLGGPPPPPRERRPPPPPPPPPRREARGSSSELSSDEAVRVERISVCSALCWSAL